MAETGRVVGTDTTGVAVNVDPSGFERQVVNIGDPVQAATASVMPAGFLRVTDEPTQLFYDAFDGSIDTLNMWAYAAGSGGSVASDSGGFMTMGSGTTASAYSVLTSQPTFKPTTPAWLGVSLVLSLSDGAAPTANTFRFWGFGTTPGTPTAAAPLTDAVGFELSTAGKMYAVIYANGTRTAVQDLSTSGNSTQPLNANQHRYGVYVRTDTAYWFIDTLTNVVATSSFQAPSVQTLPVKMLTVNATSAPSASGTLVSSGVAVWDTGKNNTALSDGTFPWRKAAVNSSGALSVAVGNVLPSTLGASAVGTQGPVNITTYGNVLLTLRTFTGTTPSVTYSLQATEDGADWVTLQGLNVATGQVASSWTQAAALAAGTAGPSVQYSTLGYIQVRVNVTAISGTSPSALWGVMPSVMPFHPAPGVIAQGTTPTGGTLVTSPVAVSGTDSGSVVRSLRTDTSGLLLIGAGGATMGFVNPAPATSATAALSTGLASSLTVLNIKASAGNVYGMSIQNGAAATTYIQFYNTAGTPTLGTSVIWWIAVPASSVVNLPPGTMALAQHATGIGIGASTTPTSTGTPATAPNVTVFYK